MLTEGPVGAQFELEFPVNKTALESSMAKSQFEKFTAKSNSTCRKPFSNREAQSQETPDENL